MLLAFSMRQYLDRTRESVEEVQARQRASSRRARSASTATYLARSPPSRARSRRRTTTAAATSSASACSRSRSRATLGYRGDDLEAIEVGALLHDIGKIGVPERILNKPGPLTDDEWEEMKQHPVTSDYILAGIEMHPFVRQIVRSSHERIDGKGYPDGLAGDGDPAAGAHRARRGRVRRARERPPLPAGPPGPGGDRGAPLARRHAVLPERDRRAELLWHDNPEVLRGECPNEERVSPPALRAVQSVVAAA